MSSRALAPVGLAALVLACALATSCKSDKEPAKGELMLSIQTDMEIPKDITRIELEVTVHGTRVWYDGWEVGPTGVKIPATIAIVAGKDPSTPVKIRVAALQGTNLRTFKEVVTTVPSNRIALLRVPMQWLCDDHAKKTGDGLYESTCPLGQTCEAGACVDYTVDSTLLDTYKPELVYGGAAVSGGKGRCLDTIACFSKGYTVQFDPADCSVPAPAGGAGVNVALVNKPGSDGICGPHACLIPFDEEPNWGFQIDSGRIKLPKTACDRVQKGRSEAIAVTTACETKTPSMPTCGPWSSVDAPAEFDASAPQPAEAGAGGTDGGGDAQPDTSSGGTGGAGEGGAAGQGGSGGITDSGVDAPTGPFACMGNLNWPTPGQPSYALGLTFQSAANSAPLSQLNVKACPKLDGTCAAPTATGTTNTSGYVSLTVPSLPEGIDAYFEVTGATIPTTLVYLTFADPSVFSQLQFTVPIVEAAMLQGLASDIGVTLNSGNGNVAFTARDCANLPAAGMAVSSPSGTTYYSNGTSLATGMTETIANGQGMIFNVMPGASMQTGIVGSTTAGSATIPVWIRADAVTSMNVVPWK